LACETLAYLWRAGCVGTRTSGSEGGPGKRIIPKGRQRAPVRPYADWSPDGGSQSRIADVAEHQAFERQAMGLYIRLVRVVGLSSECANTQRTSVLSNRLYRLGELWGDPDLMLGRSLGLPTFTDAGTAYYRRATLFFDRGCLEKVFFPVESPRRCAAQVVSWLTATGRY
jgi:hypothetical protein